MKTQLLGLGAAALLLAASASASASTVTLSESQAYNQHAQPKADALLRASGIGPQDQVISVRAKVEPDGRLAGMKVLKSSGSSKLDSKVAEVLRRLIVIDPPLGLFEGAVTLNVGQGAVLEAQAQSR